MCTCFTYLNHDFYVGRNLDLDCTFNEQVVVMPRKFKFPYKYVDVQQKYALMGMATVMDGVPLFAEAMNEKGLVMCGLQFSENAVYFPFQEDKENITSFEIIPWLLSQCACLDEARALLDHLHIVDTCFKENVPTSPLHWMISDENESIVIESCHDGLHIYENPLGVMTNNPPFPFHLWNANQYMNCTKAYPENRFSQDTNFKPFGVGMGAFGLPGDSSSSSRFVRTCFLKENMTSSGNEVDNVQQCFRVLNQVSMIKGCVNTLNHRDDYTTYSCVMNASCGLYYYMTYENFKITKLAMYDFVDLDHLSCFELDKKIGDNF